MMSLQRAAASKSHGLGTAATFFFLMPSKSRYVKGDTRA